MHFHTHLVVSAASTGHLVLGPIPRGYRIRRLSLVWGNTENTTIVFGFTLARSDSATLANFQAGTTFIQRSPAVSGPIPVATLRTAANVMQEMTLGVDALVAGQTSWVIGQVANAGAADMNILAGVEVEGATPSGPVSAGLPGGSDALRAVRNEAIPQGLGGAGSLVGNVGLGKPSVTLSGPST